MRAAKHWLRAAWREARFRFWSAVVEAVVWLGYYGSQPYHFALTRMMGAIDWRR